MSGSRHGPATAAGSAQGGVCLGETHMALPVSGDIAYFTQPLSSVPRGQSISHNRFHLCPEARVFHTTAFICAQRPEYFTQPLSSVPRGQSMPRVRGVPRGLSMPRAHGVPRRRCMCAGGGGNCGKR
eukprot:366176-Chlamydomonas_euryale.AAC.5